MKVLYRSGHTRYFSGFRSLNCDFSFLFFCFFKLLYLIECNWRHESFYVYTLRYFHFYPIHVIINIDWKRFVKDSTNLWKGKRKVGKRKKYLRNIENEKNFSSNLREGEKNFGRMKCMLELAHSTSYDFFYGFHLERFRSIQTKFQAAVNDPAVVKYSDLLSDY